MARWDPIFPTVLRNQRSYFKTIEFSHSFELTVTYFR